jgi:predicted TIM-barrel fold metal-dependent hydrolase
MRMLDFHVHYNGDLAEANKFVDAWKAGGVEKACVFGYNANDGSHPSIRDLVALRDRFPDFVIPFGYVNQGHEDGVAAVREAAAAGFKGMKFIYPAKPYDDDEYLPIYEAAAKAGMVCLFHTGIVIGTSGKGSDFGTNDFQRGWRVSSNYMRPANIDRIARIFPDMPIIGAHFGGAAWYEEAAHVMKWNANVYFDLCIGQFHYVRKGVPEGQEARAIKPRIQEIRDVGGLNLKKILFGTDGLVGKPDPNPRWSLRTVQFELDGLGATEEEKEAVYWGTAAGLLGLK